MSLIQRWWESTPLALRPISLTPRAVNSGSSLAKAPSSVVQMGVKSSGWEKRMAHLSPMKSWKLMGPLEVSESKLGATEPRRRLVGEEVSLEHL